MPRSRSRVTSNISSTLCPPAWISSKVELIGIQRMSRGRWSLVGDWTRSEFLFGKFFKISLKDFSSIRALNPAIFYSLSIFRWSILNRVRRMRRWTFRPKWWRIRFECFFITYSSNSFFSSLRFALVSWTPMETTRKLCVKVTRVAAF